MRSPLCCLLLVVASCGKPMPTSHLARAVVSVSSGITLGAGEAQSGDGYGTAVAVGPRWAAVGAPAGDGKVYFYAVPGFAPAGSVGGVANSGEGLGRSLAALPDGRFAAGATGSVTILEHTASGWGSAGKLPAADYAGNDFGTWVSATNDAVVVGAPNHTHAGVGAGTGAAYIYNWSDPSWADVGELWAPANASDFGTSVGISGSVIVVGSPVVTENTVYRGAVYVYVIGGAHWPAPEATLRTLASGSMDGFGQVVAADESAVFATALQIDALYQTSAPYNATSGALLMNPPVALQTSVAAHDRLVIASSGTGGGAAYAVVYGQGTWAQLAAPGALNGFGAHVATNGREALVAAPFLAGSGRVVAYTLLRALGDWCAVPAECASGNCVGASCAPPDDAAVPPQDDAAVPPPDASPPDDAAVPTDGPAGDGPTQADAAPVDGGAGDAPVAVDGATDGSPAHGDGGAGREGGGRLAGGAPAADDFYRCDCTIGGRGGPPRGLLALALGAALLVARTGRRRAR
ncbi:MAG TPA: hypothetical protein VGQ83_01120 [Polyangia bacterium]